MRFSRRSRLAAVLAATIGHAMLAQDPVPTPQPAPNPGSAPPPVSAPAPAPVPTPSDAQAPGIPPATGEAAAPVAAPAPSAATAPGIPAGPVAAPTPVAAPAVRIVDAPSVWIAKLPSDNPYGAVSDAAASLPPKLPFTDTTIAADMFVSVRVDATGKPSSVRRDRDPIPSLAAETTKSIQRWTITPARRGGQPVDTWGVYRIQLAVEVDAPKITQLMMTPVTPSTPLPAPFVWPTEAEWLESRHPAPMTDGTVSILEVDTAPVPQKSPWSADSYKGPFSVRFWIKIGKTGRIERAIPVEVSDPVLLAYVRRTMATWTLKPAQSKGVPVESWNELAISGHITFDDEIKQIAALRRAVGP